MRNGMVLAAAVVFAVIQLMAAPAFAGTVDPGSAPAAGSGMPGTTDIYNRLATGAAIAAPGVFKEPGAGPTAGAAKSLKDIGDILPAPDNSNGASASDVLGGKTFWGLRTDGTWGVKSGTLTVTTGANVTGTNGSLSVTIPNGLYSGNKTVTAADTNLAAGNIVSGTTIFGTKGTFIPRALAKRVNKTGQTGCWDAAGTGIPCAGTGQDGAFQYGIDPAIAPAAGTSGAYNTPALASGVRFTDNGDGTVTDNLTSLIWLKNANCFSLQTWAAALTSANTLASGACGLGDGSTAGQWRLPNINELHSLGPTWPPGNPFTGVQANYYWSSSSYANGPNGAWNVGMHDGGVVSNYKAGNGYVWPVRAGQ